MRKKATKDLNEYAYAMLKGIAKRKRKSLLLSYPEYVSLKNKGCEECKKSISGRSIGLELITKNGSYSKDNVKVICGVCRAEKAAQDFDFIKYSINQLRRGWKKTPNALLAIQRARNDDGEIQCKACSEWFPASQIDLDHVAPAIPPETGYTTLDSFAQKLLCKAEGLQTLCHECHQNKTRLERQLRKEFGTIKSGKQRKLEQRKLIK